MYKLIKILLIIVVLVVLIWYFNIKYKNNYIPSEMTQISEEAKINEEFTNMSNNLNYSQTDNIDNIFSNPPQNPMGPSQISGINIGQNQDFNNSSIMYDNRGFNWNTNTKDPQIDEFTKAVNDQQLQNKFERMYMLDPDGSVAQYDITYSKVSPNCCPAQYAPPFKLTDKNSSNCDFAQKYVANQYSGMNFNDGYGCACVTPKQADFYGSRGGNTN